MTLREKLLAVLVLAVVAFITWNIFWGYPKVNYNQGEKTEAVQPVNQEDSTPKQKKTTVNNSNIPVQGSNLDSATNNAENVPAQMQYDFFMTVKPITSDLPTVIIGRSQDPERKTYIYADNPGFEDAEIQLIKESGKYYYRYKNKTQSSPRNYEGDMISFQPAGSILGLSVVSSVRKGDNDGSGVNLSIINKTDLKLNVKIDYDDVKKPRVNIVNKVGDIYINK